MLPVGENDPQNELWVDISAYLTHVLIIPYRFYELLHPEGCGWPHGGTGFVITILPSMYENGSMTDSWTVRAPPKNFWTKLGHQKYARQISTKSTGWSFAPTTCKIFGVYPIPMWRDLLFVRLTKCVKTAISSKQLGCEGPLAKLVAEAHHARRSALFGVWLAGGVRYVGICHVFNCL